MARARLSSPALLLFTVALLVADVFLTPKLMNAPGHPILPTLAGFAVSALSFVVPGFLAFRLYRWIRLKAFYGTERY